MNRRVIALALALAACGDDPSAPGGEPLVATLRGGTAQTAIAGTAVAAPPAVLVTRGGLPVAGVSVQFRVTTGGGVLEGANQVTGANGVATADRWILGNAGQQAVEAIIGDALGSPIRFAAVATVADPVAVAPLQGNNLTSTVGLPVEMRPILRVSDAAGRPIPGVVVDWRIGSGGGGLRYGDIATGQDGTAGVVKWVLGTQAGENTLIATVSCSVSCAPVVFRATGVAGAVAHVVRVAGDGQQATAGTVVATPPSVRLTDGYGNPALGRTVTFEVIAGGGIVTGASAVSGADGIATVGSWTLGPVPGPNQLRATVEGQSTTFVATGN